MLKSPYWRVLIGALSAIGVFVVSISTLGWPSRQFWLSNQAGALGAAGVVALGAINGAVESFRSARRERQEGLEAKLRVPLSALFVNLLDQLGSEHYKDIWVHCFLLRRKPPSFRRQLARVGGFGLKSRPKAGVRWCKGKGLIGECWEKNADVGANLEQDWEGLRALSRVDWEALDSEVRYGLSYDEYQRTKHYEAIVATPVQTKKGRFAGCISVDSMAPNFDALWSDPVRESMQNAAQAVAQVAKLS